MSGSAFAVTHHAFSSGAGRTSDGNGSHASTLKSPSYTKSVSWQHYLNLKGHYDSKEEGFANRYNFAYLLHKHHAKAAKQHLSRNQHQELAVRFFP
ncbi:putative IS1 encoded protein [Shigella flexneri 2002017]|nr:putative IS1 encoded protein [Shigella flexneri 2002017]